MRPPLRYAVGVALAVTAAAVLTVGGAAAPASAHAYLASSTPVDGASLAQAPTSVELHFTEHVVLESTEVVVTDTRGHRVPATKLSLVGEDEDRESPATVVAALPALGVGAYHVSWRTLSSDDLHESGGILAFGFQSTVQAAGPSEASPDGLELVGRWSVLGALAAGLGAVVVGRLLLARAPRDTSAVRAVSAAGVRRLRRVAGRLLVAAAGAALLVLLADVIRFGSQAVTAGYAARWGARELALAVAAVTLLGRGPADEPPARRHDVVAAAALVGAGLSTVLLGHVGLRGGPSWLLASTAHLLASLLWLGSVCGLAFVAARPGRFGLSRPEVGPVVRLFAIPATTAVAVVVVSGLYLASDVVVSVDAGLLTTYGRILAAKLLAAAFVGVVALGTARATRADRAGQGRRAGLALRAGSTPAPRTPRLGLEAAALGLVVALGGLLATGQPATAPQLVTRDEPSVLDSQAVADLQQTVAMRPNRPGASVAMVDVLDTRRPSPGPVTGVTVTLRGATDAAAGPLRVSGAAQPVAAEHVTGSRWAAGLDLPDAGPVELAVTVHRRGLADVGSTIRWVVGPSAPAPATVVSRAPISEPLVRAAVLLSALGGFALLWLVWKGFSRRRPGSLGEIPSGSVPFGLYWSEQGAEVSPAPVESGKP